MHQAHHQLIYVLFSIIVAILGSWTALDLQRQVRAHSGRIRLYWLTATATSMGLSIFSMHFIAMLGFDAGTPIRYDFWLTFASLLVAIAATSFAFMAVQTSEATRLRVALAALAMGLGIGVMHYMGMAAMRTPATLSYDPWLVAASFLIAIGVSWVALAAALRNPRLELRLLGAVVLGLAISSMHYTAMAAASFKPTRDAVLGTGGLDQLSLALWVGTGTMVMLFFALVSAMFDRRFEALALKEAAAIATREAHLREVLTRMPLAVAVVERGGDRRVTFANAIATELWGHRHPADLPLMGLDGLSLGADAHPFVRATEHGIEFSGSLVALPGAGSTRYLELSAAPLPGVEGESEAIILTAQDVTARIEAEQVLQQSQKLETIGHLTGGVAHDFNNLLTPIIGGLDLLRRDTALSPRSKRIVDGGLQASAKAATLVQRLLAFSRRQILQPKVVDMAAILEGVHELIERSIGPTIRVNVTSEPNLSAKIDPGQFELAILNLAVNARDAMPDGGSIEISAVAEELAEAAVGGLKAGRYVRVSVVDNGLGMDQATLRRAIEPFFSTKGLGKGTGLGLSMVHGLAAQSNGLLQLSSKVGGGTRADLWLPLCQEEVEQSTASIGTFRTSPSATILLVDDEELVRRAIGEMLQEIGHEVIEASSGSEALRCLDAHPEISLIVTDHLMPGMTGAALAREVVARFAGMRLLIISGYAEPADLPPSIPSLRKPFTAEQLSSVVANLLAAERKVVPLRRQNSGN